MAVKRPIIVYKQETITNSDCEFWLLSPSQLDLYMDSYGNICTQSKSLEVTLTMYHRLGLIVFQEEDFIKSLAQEYAEGVLNLTKEVFAKNLAVPFWSVIEEKKLGEKVNYPSDLIRATEDYPEIFLNTGEYLEDYCTLIVEDNYGLLSSPVLLSGLSEQPLDALDTILDRLSVRFLYYECVLTMRDLAENSTLLDDFLKALLKKDFMFDYGYHPQFLIKEVKILSSVYFEHEMVSEDLIAMQRFRTKPTKALKDALNNLDFTVPSSEASNHVGRIFEIECKTPNARYLENSTSLINFFKYRFRDVIYGKSSGIVIKFAPHSTEIKVKNDDTLIINVQSVLFLG